MDSLNTIEVTISGENITLVATEEVQYMRKLADYIDGKINEITAGSACASSRPHKRNLLVALIIADELFKARDTMDDLSLHRDKEIQKNERLQNLIDELRQTLETTRSDLEQTRDELAAYIESRESTRGLKNIIMTDDLMKSTWVTHS
jgi:cell division protein ZapA